MKQTYLQPVVEILSCQLQGTICAGSGGPKTITVTPSQFATTGYTGD